MYLGNQPALAYTSFAKQDFTTSATTNYVLDQAVTNANEIALFINFVRQEPTTAYTASGTALTLTSATTAGDDMYCIFLGKALQTVNPPAGSVGSSQINYPLTTFSSTGIDDNATSTAVTIDSSQNVGIGTASPQEPLSINIGLSDTKGLGLQYSNETKAGIKLNPASGEVRIGAFNSTGTYSTSFYSNNAERMRITADGKFGMNGKTNPQYTMEFGDSGSGNGWSLNAENNVHKIRSRSSASDTQTHVQWENTNGIVGTIKTNGSATQYNTSSDYRLKENVNYDFDATSRLKQLKPARFNFIADANTTVDGFIAHEVSSVVPEAISGEKDAMITEEYEITPAVLDENGNVITEAVMGTREVPDYQGIDQSKLVPLLVKTIQELEARITALENA